MANTQSRTDRDRISRVVATLDSAYTIVEDTLVLAASAGGAYAVTLPLAASVAPGVGIVVKKTDVAANTVTVTRAGADTIDGATTYALATQYKYVHLVSDGGTKWHVVANN